MEENLFTTVFSELKHPIRREIVKFIGMSRKNYTEILEKLNIDKGKLNFHLRNLKNLVHHDTDGLYELTELGKSSLDLIEKIESFKGIKSEQRWMNASVAITYLALFSGVLTLMSPFVNYFVLLTGVSAIFSALLLAFMWGNNRIPFIDKYEIKFIAAGFVVSALFFSVFYYNILPQMEQQLLFKRAKMDINTTEPVKITIPSGWHYSRLKTGFHLISPDRNLVIAIYASDFPQGSLEKTKERMIEYQSPYGLNLNDNDFFATTVCNVDAYYHEYIQRSPRESVNERLYFWYTNGRMYMFEVNIPENHSYNKYMAEIEYVLHSLKC